VQADRIGLSCPPTFVKKKQANAAAPEAGHRDVSAQHMHPNNKYINNKKNNYYGITIR
jgi:hypothetical protein